MELQGWSNRLKLIGWSRGSLPIRQKFSGHQSAFISMSQHLQIFLQHQYLTISTSDTGPKLVTKMSVFTSVRPPIEVINNCIIHTICTKIVYHQCYNLSMNICFFRDHALGFNVKITSRSRSQSVVITIQKSIQNEGDIVRVNLPSSLYITKSAEEIKVKLADSLYSNPCLSREGRLTLSSR